MSKKNQNKIDLKYTLTDQKGYNAQVNCVVKIRDRKIIVAGEDGLIKIVFGGDMESGDIKESVENNLNNKNNGGNKNIVDAIKEIYLEKMTDANGFLANIEDCAEFENGDIVCVCTDGDVGLYIKNKAPSLALPKGEEDGYLLKKIDFEIRDDCIYFVKIINDEKEIKNNTNRSVEVWGEKNIKYKIEIK